MLHPIKITKGLLLTFSLLLPAGILEGYNLNNPALTPIKLEKPLSHAPLKFVENGKLNFIIVTAKGRKRLPQVGILREAFEKCTGKIPEVADVTEQEKIARYPYQFLVGASPMTSFLQVDVEKLPKDGFTIRTFPKGIAIIGYDTGVVKQPKPSAVSKNPFFRGSQYGALDFVERFMGCRFYYPGDYGTIWPKIKNLSLAPCRYTDGPYFLTRDDTYFIDLAYKRPVLKKLFGKWRKDKKRPYFESDRFDFTVRYRMGAAVLFHPMHEPRPNLLMKHYPEKKDTIFFKSVSGYQYYNPKHHEGNDFDLTNLEFADILIDAMEKFYNSKGKEKRIWGATPTLNQVVFGQCDGEVSLGDMINNPTVKKLNLITPAHLKRGSAMSDVYGRFLQYYGNKVKEKFPKVRIAYLAYQGGTRAPLDTKRWKLPDNIDVEVCAHVFPRLARNPKKTARMVEMLKEWYKAQGNRPVQALWIYHIPENSSSPFLRAIAAQFVGDIPKVCGPYLGRIKLYFDQYARYGLDFRYYYSEYVGQRAKWNPDLNVDAAIEEHWVPFYGAKAAPHLKEFHRILKECYLKYYVMPEKSDLNPLYPPSILNKLEKLLKNAEKALDKKSIEYKRYLIFADPWMSAINMMRVRQNYVRRTHLAYRLLPTDKLSFDGKGNEPFWKKVKEAELMDPRGESTTLVKPARIKMAWDDKNLYGLVEMDYPYTPLPKKDIWHNDSWEIHLSPGMKHEQMFQYVFDAIGQKFNAHKRIKPISTPFNIDYKSPGYAFRIWKGDGKKWSAEFKISFADLRISAPKPYECWHWNGVWNKLTPPGDFKSTSLTFGDNHNYHQYGILKFDGKRR